MIDHRLSEHFFLSEFLRSETAARRGIDNTPGPEVLRALEWNAANMEQVRTVLNQAIQVSSGYRSPALNRAIGSADTSAHIKGLACDFTAPSFGLPIDVCDQIVKSGIQFDQLIHEHTWVHIAWAGFGSSPRRQVLTLTENGNYVHGIVGRRAA